MRATSSLKLAPWQAAALPIYNPYDHFAMLCGVATGKTTTGALFAIYHITNFPELTGFIGANTYDQLNKATLRVLFEHLNNYNIPYVIDTRPPKEWGYSKWQKELRSYKNVLSCYWNGKIVTIFVNVLQDGDAFRGIEFSWYWIDETRDTPLNTHDVILSRLRESTYKKGIITTTTAGEDWCYQRFVSGMKKNDKRFGSMHVRTSESVKVGIITQDFYETMRAAYSPKMAMQELDALHINLQGGTAYYAASERNKRRIAPWGDQYPSTMRPLIIGCDFNFQPAPCVWMVGQVGPDLVSPKTGLNYSDCIHWFGEISDTQISTADMTLKLIAQYPGFFYQVFGDASGQRGSTSNAGVTDYNQMKNTFDEHECVYGVNVEQNNPFVKDRVETMNALLRNSRGQIRMTYDPVNCPHFDADMRVVGWKKFVGVKQKLDDGGDVNRTHASDGAGYAAFKLFPVGRRAFILDSIQSPMIQTIQRAL